MFGCNRVPRSPKNPKCMVVGPHPPTALGGFQRHIGHDKAPNVRAILPISR